jgi:hypothetical protein
MGRRCPCRAFWRVWATCAAKPRAKPSERLPLPQNTRCRQGPYSCYTGVMPDGRDQRRVERRLRANLPHMLGDDQQSVKLRLWLIADARRDVIPEKKRKPVQPKPAALAEQMQQRGLRDKAK